MTIEIRKAERAKAKLRLGLAGPSGAGKTMSSLKLAKGMAGEGGRVVIIDTERGSGELYADLYAYDIVTIEPPYTPGRYVEAIEACEKAGYDVIIIDSLSHAWSDEGGILDQADKKRGGSGDSFRVWAELTPQHRKLVNGMLNSKAHIIATVRSKQEYALAKNEQTGKSSVQKLGMAPVQRDGMEYEFTVFMDIDQGHNANASKDRTNLFKDRIFVIDEKIGQELMKWLDQGVDRALLENKKKIMMQLKYLDEPCKTAQEIAESVLRITKLPLEQKHFAEIITFLDVTARERKDAAVAAAKEALERAQKGPVAEEKSADTATEAPPADEIQYDATDDINPADIPF